MNYKNEDAFAKDFKEKTEGLYLLYGAESYLIDAWSSRVVKRACGGSNPDAFSFQKLDGRKPDIDALIDATEALPLGATEKCVLLDGLEPAKLNADALKTLEALLSDLNPACVLVITGREPGFDKSSAAGKKLIKLCGEHGAAVELGSRGASGLAAFVKACGKKNGQALSNEICRYILETCDNAMNSLANETAKICAYAGAAEVTRAHVDAVATPRIEARVFDLSRCILSGNTQRAFEILANLFSLREPPVAIIAVLAMSYADLYRARVAKDEGQTPADVISAFGFRSDFRVNSAFSARISAGALRQSLALLLDCDLKMKSTGLDDKILLEKTVAELFAARSA
jgi:DNA polymerase-3 subunit delta